MLMLLSNTTLLDQEVFAQFEVDLAVLVQHVALEAVTNVVAVSAAAVETHDRAAP